MSLSEQSRETSIGNVAWVSGEQEIHGYGGLHAQLVSKCDVNLEDPLCLPEVFHNHTHVGNCSPVRIK